MHPFNSSEFYNTGIVQRLFEAADEGLDPSLNTSLFEETEKIAIFLENEKNTASKEEIQALSLTILQEFNKYSENSLKLSEWLAKTKIAYKSLHHLFIAIAKINAKSEDSGRSLDNLEYIDTAALDCIKNRQNPYEQDSGHLLEASLLQSKITEAAKYLDINRYQHLNVFGNKHKHNVMLKDLAAFLKVEGVIVPDSYGIDTGQILDFLKLSTVDSSGQKISKLWEQLGSLYEKNGNKNFFKNSEVSDLIAAITKTIKKAFNKIDSEVATKPLNLSKEMHQWIADVKKRGSFLITRSSGAEDTRTSANAGGNVSVPYVKPEVADYAQSLGEVVASYFSEASLKNRINSGQNPFDEPFKLAVTMQEIVGEEIGGSLNPKDVPISLVIFTNEPLYTGNEKFRVMRISATYGHGEGVVGNEGIATDTILILQNASNPEKLHVVYDNQHKSERLAPVMDNISGKVKLKKIANTNAMAVQPVLNDNLIQRLFQWSVIVEKFFAEPTDMEIVIKNNMIHPVQARSINRPDLLPTYIDLKKIKNFEISPISDSLALDMIVPGQASVVEITGPGDILIDQTLANAELLFETDKHKLVIVGQKEGANTHPVVNFSDMGIPCLYAQGKKYETMHELVEKIDSAHHLAICMQAATIYIMKTEIPIQEYSSKGFVIHPAKVAISFPVKGDVSRKSVGNPEIPQEIKDLLLNIRTADTSKATLDLLDDLKNHGWLKEFREIINDLKDSKKGNPLLKRMIKPIIAAARSVESKVNYTFSEVRRVLGLVQDPGRMELLMNVKILETMLFQESTESSIGKYSVLNLQESFGAANDLIAYQMKLSHQAHFADFLMDGQQSPVEEVFNEWQAFLLQLEPVVEKTINGEDLGLTLAEISRFKAVLNTLRQAGVLPLFMTFFFHEIFSQNSIISTGKEANAIEKLRVVTELLPINDEPIIEQIFIWKKEIRQLRSDIWQIGNPKAYRKMFERLQSVIENFLPDKLILLQKNEWESASPIVRSIVLQTMNELVDLYDTAVKTMKASSEFKDPIEKTQNFKEMLGPYFELLNGWAQQTVGGGGFALQQSWPLDKYMEEIKSIFLKLSDTDPIQLRPSSLFSVSAAVLGSGTIFERHQPKTLEDVFTLIHQNLMASTDVLTKELFSLNQIQSSILPDYVKTALELTGKIGGEGVGKPQFFGMHVEKTEIAFYYNVPLRNHSGKFTIHYDRKTKKMSMEAQFLGPGGVRWSQGLERILFLDTFNLIHLQSKPKLGNDELIFKWDVTQSQHLLIAYEEYHSQAAASLGVIVDYTDQFASLIIKNGNVNDLGNFLSENSIVSTLEKTLLELFIDEILLQTIETNLSSATVLKIIKKSDHPILDWVIKALILQLKERDVEISFKNIPDAYKATVVRMLEYFKTDPTLMPLSGIKRDASEIWMLLLSKDKYISEAISAAQEGIREPDGLAVYDSNSLWSVLIEEGIGIPEAIALYSLLIDNGIGIPPAIAAAQQGIKDTHDTIRLNALKLWLKLLKADVGIVEAIAAAREGIKNKDAYMRSSFLELVQEIVKVDRSFIFEALEAAHEGMNDTDDNIRYYAIGLFSDIVKLDNTFVSEAIPIALELTYDPRFFLDTRLWISLFAHNSGFSEAYNAVQNGINSPVSIVQRQSLRLLKLLVENNYDACTQLAISEGIKGIKVGEHALEYRELLKELVLKNKGVLEIIQFVKQISKNFQYPEFYDASMLWGMLIKQNLGIKDCIAIVQEGFKSSDGDVRLNAIELWGTLIKNGFGISEAIIAAEEGVNNINNYLFIWDFLLKTNEGLLAAQTLIDQELPINPMAIKKLKEKVDRLKNKMES